MAIVKHELGHHLGRSDRRGEASVLGQHDGCGHSGNRADDPP